MRTSSEFEQLIKSRTFVSKILWFALTFSILIYVFVAYQVALQNTDTEPAELNAMFKQIMYAVAAATVCGSLIARAVLFSESRLKNMLQSTDEQMSSGESDKISANELRALGLFARLFTPYIVILAINESVVIYGLILSFMAHRGDEILPFALAAIVLNATMFGKLAAAIRQGLELLEDPRFGRRG
ncbi:MAG: hypothetical protein GY854_04580 [Deltaproteobacteria bacterium]|nr:hypothetical protein [Deltaproteobacteria bacterium]